MTEDKPVTERDRVRPDILERYEAMRQECCRYGGFHPDSTEVCHKALRYAHRLPSIAFHLAELVDDMALYIAQRSQQELRTPPEAQPEPGKAQQEANMMSRVFLAAMAWSGSEPSTSVLYREIDRARKLIAAPPSLKEQGAQEKERE